MGFLEMDSCVSQSETSISCISAMFLCVIQVKSSANFYRLLAVRRLIYDDEVESMAVGYGARSKYIQ